MKTVHFQSIALEREDTLSLTSPIEGEEITPSPWWEGVRGREDRKIDTEVCSAADKKSATR